MASKRRGFFRLFTVLSVFWIAGSTGTSIFVFHLYPFPESTGRGNYPVPILHHDVKQMSNDELCTVIMRIPSFAEFKKQTEVDKYVNTQIRESEQQTRWNRYGYGDCENILGNAQAAFG